MALNNSIYVIHPYIKDGIWMYDDDKMDIKEEPFVLGADDFLTLIAEGKDKVSLMFSKKEMPFEDVITLKRLAGYGDGYYYKSSLNSPILWLCGVTKLYFGGKHPEIIYVHVIKNKP